MYLYLHVRIPWAMAICRIILLLKFSTRGASCVRMVVEGAKAEGDRFAKPASLPELKTY